MQISTAYKLVFCKQTKMSREAAFVQLAARHISETGAHSVVALIKSLNA